MKILKIFSTLFLVFLPPLEAEPLKVKVHAPQAVLYNPDNEAILFQKRAFDPCYPASVIKMATALFVLEKKKIALSTPFTTSKEAICKINAPLKHADPTKYVAHILEHDGRNLGLVSGEIHSFETLLHALLIGSANDAANVIAENSCGSIELFIQEINSYLKEAGFVQTQMQNPHGLYHPAQLSTPYEIAKMAALGLKNAIFAEVIGKKSFPIQRGKKKTITTLSTGNRLLKPGPYYYPKVIGGKTGFFSKAGYNLVAIAQEGERTLIASIFGCKTAEERYEDAISLFETAFKEKKTERLLFNKDSSSFSLEIPKAKIPLKGILDKNFVLSYFPSEAPQTIHAHVTWDLPPLPISKGSKVGELLVENEKHLILGKASLFAQETVALFWYYHMIQWIEKRNQQIGICLVIALAACFAVRNLYGKRRAS